VRATYMYSAMADIAAIQEDEEYLRAITAIWEDIVHRKIYVTGGIGATGGNEGFAGPYFLPNMTAYCETCASIGNIFMNHRLFLLHGQSRFIDVLEKTLYNAALSGVSLSADRFFYPNPLESKGQHQRSEWFGCACCPSNIARFIPAIPGYVYAVTDNELFVNLYISNEAEIIMEKNKLNISQKTRYPYDGDISITINPQDEKRFALKIRVPGWSLNEALPGGLYRFAEHNTDSFRLYVNAVPVSPVMSGGYAVIERTWRKGDNVDLFLPMPVRRVLADERIKENAGRVAIQRGPLIYCAEWPDNHKGDVLSLVLGNEGFSTGYREDLLNGTQVIAASGARSAKTPDGRIELLTQQEVRLIPYALWNNRGSGEMRVWMPVTTAGARPLPAPTIAFRSRIRASRPEGDLAAVNDQDVPSGSNDRSVTYYHWWPGRDRWEYIQYDFEKPATVTKTKVYWFDDGPDGGCRVPDEWQLLYLNKNIWTPVRARTSYKVTKNNWDSLMFDPVKTSAVKLKVKLNRAFSSGVYEWIIE